MDRKAAILMGFAVLTVLAAIGMLSVFSLTVLQPTEASGNDTLNLSSANWERSDGSILTRQGTTAVTASTGSAPIEIHLSSNSGSPGDRLALIARGVTGGESTVFWLDINGNGAREVPERDLCKTEASDDGAAKCSITITTPPFVLGKGTECSLPVPIDCNFINVTDSEGRTTSPLDQVAVDRQTFEVMPAPPPPTPTLTPPPPTPSAFLSVPNPLAGPAGTQLRVSGSNFDPGQSVSIIFGDEEPFAVDADLWGRFSITFEVPNVTPGVYTVVVDNTVPLPFTVTPTIHACFKNHNSDQEKQGNLRIVTDPANCEQNETPLSWNQR